MHFVDVDFEDDSNIYVQVNDTVLHAAATPPVFSSGWRHVALTYQQPYTMLCQGGGFEVKKGDNFNFNRDFSIAMTFSVSDVNTEQGLLYKGTGSDTTTPQLSMSYRVGVSGGNVTLQLIDADGNGQPVVHWPADHARSVLPAHHRQDSTTTPAGRDDTRRSVCRAVRHDRPRHDHDGQWHVGQCVGFPSGGGDITISSIACRRKREYANEQVSR